MNEFSSDNLESLFSDSDCDPTVNENTLDSPSGSQSDSEFEVNDVPVCDNIEDNSMSNTDNSDNHITYLRKWAIR